MEESLNHDQLYFKPEYQILQKHALIGPVTAITLDTISSISDFAYSTYGVRLGEQPKRDETRPSWQGKVPQIQIENPQRPAMTCAADCIHL
eukprot:scaffold73483_cov46-Attheya_sp.AAC.3